MGLIGQIREDGRECKKPIDVNLELLVLDFQLNNFMSIEFLILTS